MDRDVHVYNVRAGELDEIELLYKTLSPQRQFNKEQFLNAMFDNNSNCSFHTTSLDGKIIGMVSLGWVKYGTKTKGYIEDVVVHEQYRNNGVASYLIEKAIEAAKELGCETIDLTSNDTRIEAHGLYRKFGFTNPETNLFRLHL
jgi:ribosomal protein S18 acetylase RimI-like enzyme